MDFSLLKLTGINTDTAIERFMGNEMIYIKMLKKFIDDSTFSKFSTSAEIKDNKSLFEASHTLKGI